ncbi:hypothetical protein BN903_88 [Halorubrum sp. AJ67]|nr:hypothetical protein BN903_88 [Halorubrum sp. AJ67]
MVTVKGLFIRPRHRRTSSGRIARTRPDEGGDRVPPGVGGTVIYSRGV